MDVLYIWHIKFSIDDYITQNTGMAMAVVIVLVGNGFVLLDWVEEW